MDVPIIHGTSVPSSDYKYAAPTDAYDQDGSLVSLRAEEQPRQYRDLVWAVAFVVHLVVMTVLIMLNGGNNAGVSYNGVYVLVGTTAVSTIALGGATLQFMMKFPEPLVKTSLLATVGLSGVFSILGFLAGSALQGVLGLVFFAIGVCYARTVWPRIPFAAANLNTALTAVRANMGLSVIAYIMVLLAFGWSILFFIGMGDSLANSNSAIVFFLSLSYYWVHQVLSNTVQTTVAGTIGTWWFVPEEASSCWSSAIQDSFGRATTYSFGSICLGSLIVAVVQALRATAASARGSDNDNAKLLVCIIDCILACIQDVIEYLNKWAYIYVGLYGFGYMEAGRNVIQLFRTKGWDVIIADNLCDRVLFIVSLCVGVITGFIGWIMAAADGNLLQAFGDDVDASTGFFVGLIVGFVFMSILMNVVGGAINTVIVCYAESPAEFQANHPQLSEEMKMAWMQAWPQLSGF